MERDRVPTREIVDIPMVRPAGSLIGLGPLDAISDVPRPVAPRSYGLSESLPMERSRPE